MTVKERSTLRACDDIWQSRWKDNIARGKTAFMIDRLLQGRRHHFRQDQTCPKCSPNAPELQELQRHYGHHNNPWDPTRSPGLGPGGDSGTLAGRSAEVMQATSAGYAQTRSIRGGLWPQTTWGDSTRGTRRRHHDADRPYRGGPMGRKRATSICRCALAGPDRCTRTAGGSRAADAHNVGWEFRIRRVGIVSAMPVDSRRL